ncbi:hypothetical protein [Chlorobium limicola]
MLDVFAQKGFDLLAVPQFDYLLKFVEHNVGLLGIAGKKAVEAFERLFKKGDACFLAHRLNRDRNAAVRLRGEVGTPVIDDAQCFFQQRALLFDKPENISGYEGGHILGACRS